MVLTILVGLVVITLCSGCSSYPPLPPPTVAPPQMVTENRRQLASSAYVVGPEDVLRITVYGHPDLSQELPIPPSGSFLYPFIGKVRAVGRTVQQLEQQMTERLANGFIVNPRLTMTVSKYRSRHVYVLGEVRAPGVYPLQYNSTFLELLSQAKGLTPAAGWYALIARGSRASSPKTRKSRSSPQDLAVTRVDLEKLFAGEFKQPIQIHSGDSIYVPKAGFVFVTGEIKQPGRYALERDLTVDKAIILAGGVTRFAAKKRLRVRRIVAGQPREYRALMHDVLQAEDVLIVPASAF